MLFPFDDTTQIIMISYHRPRDFEASIESVLENTDQEFHLSVVDNSCGKIDSSIEKYQNHPNVKIYRNPTNLGKGLGVTKHYLDIIHYSCSRYLVSIDADRRVPKNWLGDFISTAKEIEESMPFGVLAPIYKNEGQVYNPDDKLIGHGDGNRRLFADRVWYNPYTAGALLLIDMEFFTKVNGYSHASLYGHDDGMICWFAETSGRFVGFTSRVIVDHLNKDTTQEYADWKMKCIGDRTITTGYWD